jgi:hypothetical protein
VKHLFWWEHGSRVCNCCWISQHCHSRLWVLQESWPYFTRPEGPGPHLYPRYWVCHCHLKSVILCILRPRSVGWCVLVSDTHLGLWQNFFFPLLFYSFF